MKILIQSLLFIIVVALFAVTSDRLNQINTLKSETRPETTMVSSDMTDQEYLIQMIEHHQEAIIMSEQILLPTDRKEIHDLASSIIQNQSKEITIMREWLKEWYGK